MRGKVRLFSKMGHYCAKLLKATCVTNTVFSRSHGEVSVRFTCRQGHNFYLNLDELRATHQALSESPQISG